MAAKTEKQQTAKAETEKVQPVKEAAGKKFPLEKLRANCKKLFGVTDCTFTGATYGMAGSYTVEEMKAHLDKWCGMEVS